MKAKSISGVSTEEIISKVNQVIDSEFNPTLAILFLSVEQDRKTICDYLDEKNIDIFGCTTAGEFINGDYSIGSAVVLLLDMNISNYKILFEDYRGKSPVNVANQLGEKSLEYFANPALIVSSSGLFLDGEEVIRGLEKAVGNDKNIWGGKAGDDQKGIDTFVFTNNRSSNQGIITLVLDNDKIKLNGQAESGWKAVGTPKTITKREGLWIYELDDQPALDLMIKYMGYKFKQKSDTDIIYDDKVSSPLLLLRDKGEPILRSQSFINWTEKSIMLSGNFEDNSKIRFTLPPDFEVTDEVVKSSQKLKESKIENADAVIMFSCGGRLAELGPLISQEINGIKETIGAPMAGFFTYGEYGRATNGNNEYHNYTCCWIALEEK